MRSVNSVSTNSLQNAMLGGNETSLRASNPSQPFSRITKRVIAFRYSGMFPYLTVLKNSRITRSRISCAAERGPVVEEEVWTLRRFSLSYAFEMPYTQSFSQMSAPLSIYSMLNSHEAIFEMCMQGDINGLQVAFGGGGILLFVSDEEGWKLLHVSTLHLCFLQGNISYQCQYAAFYF